MGWAVFVHAQPRLSNQMWGVAGWPGRVGEERDTRAPRLSLSLFFLAWALIII